MFACLVSRRKWNFKKLKRPCGHTVGESTDFFRKKKKYAGHRLRCAYCHTFPACTTPSGSREFFRWVVVAKWTCSATDVCLCKSVFLVLYLLQCKVQKRKIILNRIFILRHIFWLSFDFMHYPRFQRIPQDRALLTIFFKFDVLCCWSSLSERLQKDSPRVNKKGFIDSLQASQCTARHYKSTWAQLAVSIILKPRLASKGEQRAAHEWNLWIVNKKKE